jgi:hypothetical protein
VFSRTPEAHVITADMSLPVLTYMLPAPCMLKPRNVQCISVISFCIYLIQRVRCQSIDREVEVHGLGQDTMSAAGEQAQLQLQKLQVSINTTRSRTIHSSDVIDCIRLCQVHDSSAPFRREMHCMRELSHARLCVVAIKHAVNTPQARHALQCTRCCTCWCCS